MKYQRIIVGLLLAIIFSLSILYSGLEYNKHDPNINYIIENFEKFNNTQISFSGVIKEVNTSTKQITISTPPYPYIIEIKTDKITKDMKQGNLVEILGILQGENHVLAEKILVVERWKSDLIIIRSLPAIPFALYLFFRTWRFNKKTYRFERRKKNA